MAARIRDGYGCAFANAGLHSDFCTGQLCFHRLRPQAIVPAGKTIVRCSVCPVGDTKVRV